MGLMMQNHTILSDQDVAQPDRSYELNPSDVAGILDQAIDMLFLEQNSIQNNFTNNNLNIVNC